MTDQPSSVSHSESFSIKSFLEGVVLTLLVVAIFGSTLVKKDFFEKTPSNPSAPSPTVSQDIIELEKKVLPSQGIVLPVAWGDLGKKMVESGVIDAAKFEQIYSQRSGLSEEEKKLLYGSDNGNLFINQQNSGFVLNLLWALGLGNKNPILEEGPMVDEKYGGAGNFASTGGWSLAKGNVMDHYSQYNFITLTQEQQNLVEKISQGIYRPCCGNSTYFPDCNHGMAMLALLELLASQGVGEDEMYKIALIVNSYWFPETYLNIAKYLQEKENTKWEKADPKKILGVDFSSGSGYQKILSQVAPVQTQAGGSCGV